MIQTDSLRHSRHSVYRISRRSGSNFYRSFHLLPPQKRHAMYALYAFARVTDDLGDCDEPTSIRGRWLDWWRQATALNLIGEDDLRQVIFPDEFRDEDLADGGRLRTLAVDVLPAVRDAAIEFSIPSRYLLEIVDGVLADQQKTRFDTYEQVEHYCYLVASAVGIACMHIWGFQGDLPLAAATDCGVGFQWTNILRDVSEDAARGRIYLPRQHYERHGLSEDDLLQGRSDDRLQCLVRDEVRRAERLFASGWTVWDSLHPDGRPMFSMMWRTYRRLLARIGEDPGGVMKRRIRLTQGDKWSIAGRHFIGPLFRRLPVPPKEVSLANQSR